MEAAFRARTLAAVTRNRSFCPWRCYHQFQHRCTCVISRAYRGHLYLPGSSHTKSFVLIPASPFLFFSLPSTFVSLSSSPLLLHRMLSQPHSHRGAVTQRQLIVGELQLSHSTTYCHRRSVQHFISAVFFESFFLLCYSCPFGSCRCAWSAVSALSIFVVWWL